MFENNETVKLFRMNLLPLIAVCRKVMHVMYFVPVIFLQMWHFRKFSLFQIRRGICPLNVEFTGVDVFLRPSAHWSSELA